jgi:hypothetical protein
VTTNPPVPDALQHLHGLLALALADERARFEALIAEHRGFTAMVAIEVSTSAMKALQRAHGGDRLGSKGVYIPALNDRLSRRDKIREMMGPAPHSRKRARQVATQMHVSEITVWRAVREKEAA